MDGFRFDLMGHLTLKCLQQLGGKTGWFGNFGWKKTGGFRFCWRVLGVGEVVLGLRRVGKKVRVSISWTKTLRIDELTYT